jgi:hypothetical protein
MVSAMQERIKSAAILYEGVIYEGWSHPEIGLKMLEDGVCPRPYPGEHQGFVTESGRFVEREEALQIAKESKQIIKKTGNPNQLYSEDIRDYKLHPFDTALFERTQERLNKEKGAK